MTITNQNLFRFRLSPNRKDRYEEAKNLGVLVLGWPLLGDVTGQSKEGLIDIFSSINEYKDLYTRQQRGMYAGYFTRMLSLKIGDYVLISGVNKEIIIAKVTKPYHFVEEYAEKHMAHQVSVKYIKEFSLNNVSKGLKRTLDAANTVVWVKETSQIEEIESIIADENLPNNVIETTTTKFVLEKVNTKIELNITGDVSQSELNDFIRKIRL